MKTLVPLVLLRSKDGGRGMARKARSLRVNGHRQLPEGEAARRGQAGADAGHPGDGDRAGRPRSAAAGRDAVRVQAEHEQGLFWFCLSGTPSAHFILFVTLYFYIFILILFVSLFIFVVWF